MLKKKDVMMSCWENHVMKNVKGKACLFKDGKPLDFATPPKERYINSVDADLLSPWVEWSLPALAVPRSGCPAPGRKAHASINFVRPNGGPLRMNEANWCTSVSYTNAMESLSG